MPATGLWAVCCLFLYGWHRLWWLLGRVLTWLPTTTRNPNSASRAKCVLSKFWLKFGQTCNFIRDLNFGRILSGDHVFFSSFGYSICFGLIIRKDDLTVLNYSPLNTHYSSIPDLFELLDVFPTISLEHRWAIFFTWLFFCLNPVLLIVRRPKRRSVQARLVWMLANDTIISYRRYSIQPGWSAHDDHVYLNRRLFAGFRWAEPKTHLTHW